MTVAKWVSGQEDTGTVEEKQSFPLKFVRDPEGEVGAQYSRTQTSDGWESRRALRHKTQEVNDSDSEMQFFLCSCGGGKGEREQEGGEKEGEQGDGSEGGLSGSMQLPVIVESWPLGTD